MTLFRFQQIKKVFRLKKSETDFIKRLSQQLEQCWDGDLKPLIVANILPADAEKQREIIKDRIKERLLDIQGPFCIYCGIHKEIIGTLDREHIALKGSYPEFSFTKQNLVLACGYCNRSEKKHITNVISVYDENYQNCEFSIVHPYFDNIEEHIELTFENANISLSPRNGSVKGDNTLRLFRLTEYEQSAFRGGAYLRSKELQRLKKSARKKAAKVVVRKYTF